jgi:hypothetical protein
MENKCCNKCNEVKPVSEFHKHKTGKFGVDSKCKVCKRLYSKKYSKTLNHKISVKKYQTKLSVIYGIFDEIECLYVGQSKWFNSRKHYHNFLIKNCKSNNKQKQLYLSLDKHPNRNIRIIEECSPEVLLQREQHYIDTLKPKYNKLS